MKNFRADEIQVISDAVAIIQKRPAMYIGAEGPTGERLAECMMSMLKVFSVFSAKVTRSGHWWIISSERDWFTEKERTDVDRVFSRIIAFPEAGRNAMRAEVLLKAFADAVVTCDSSGVHWIKGNTNLFPLPRQAALQSVLGRTVAFTIKNTRSN